MPETKVAKNRIHLDMQTGRGRTVAQEDRWPRVVEVVERLTANGGTVIHGDVVDGIPDHVVMADSEGNEFCVV